MKNTYIPFLTLTLLLATFLLSCETDNNEEPNPIETELRVVAPPNPSVFPVFLMLQDNPELNIQLNAVVGGGDVAPAFEAGEADITTIYTYIMANHSITGSIPDLQLNAIVLWDDFYVVADESINSLADLVGKTLIVTGPPGTTGENGAPDKILQAAILRAGYQLANFTIKYKLIDEAMAEVANGTSDAVLFAEPAATGFIAQSLMTNPNLHKAINLQEILGTYNSWETARLPLGGVATLKTYDTERKQEAVNAFVEAYKVAATKIMTDKNNSAQTISAGLSTYYGQMFPAPMIQRALNEGTLYFNTDYTISAIKTDLNAFINELIGQTPSDEFYDE